MDLQAVLLTYDITRKYSLNDVKYWLDALELVRPPCAFVLVLFTGQCTVVCLCFHHKAKLHVRALEGLACRKHVAVANSPAAICK